MRTLTLPLLLVLNKVTNTPLRVFVVGETMLWSLTYNSQMTALKEFHCGFEMLEKAIAIF